MWKTLTVSALLLVSATSVALATADAPTQDQLNESDVLRINSAKVVRTYSQKIPALGCFLYNQIDPAANAEILSAADADVVRRLVALRDGDADLGILQPEKRRKTLERIARVDEIWQDISAAVATLVDNPADETAIKTLKGRNLELFEVSDLLVTEISGQYANAQVMDKANAMRLNVVGRAAATTQKIAKNVCMAVTYPDEEIYSERLTETAQIFENSLKALRNGLPELGIQPAPTPEIAEMLDVALKNWSDIRPEVDLVIAERSMTGDDKLALFRQLKADMMLLDEIALAYKAYAQYAY